MLIVKDGTKNEEGEVKWWYQITVPSLVLVQISFPVAVCKLKHLMNKEPFHLFLPVCMSFHRQQKALSKETDRN